MSTPRRRSTVRLHDVSVSGSDDPDTVLTAVHDAVAAAVAVADGTPAQEAVRSAVASSVASSVAPSLEGRSRS